MSQICETFKNQKVLLFFVIVVLNIATISVFYFGNSFNRENIVAPPMKHVAKTFCQFTDYKCMFEAFQLLPQNYKQWVIDNLLNKYESWENLPDKFERMNQNPIYRKFNIAPVEEKMKVDIILIVSSAPARKDRRMAIRKTWWQQCQNSVKVKIKCVFLTDSKSDKDLEDKLEKEALQYNDIRFQNLQGGFDFGRRFLYHMVWAMINYDFQYFMRLDDDYFLCMKKFLNQVILPPPPLFHWGWVHCIQDIVRPEESIILLSRDLMEIYIGQDPYKMLCNRWGDQLLAVWKNELNITQLFYHHDVRLHHHPPAQQIPEFKIKRNVCEDYIGVHGSYPALMKILWKNRGKYNDEPNVTLSKYSSVCEYPNVMNWRNFGQEFYAEPKLCISNPDWGGTHGKTYIGRQGTK